MARVAIVDYGMGNLDSVRRAVEECGGTPVIAEQARELETADRIILPGVGAFPLGMTHLRARGFEEALAEQVIGKGIPFLGICLGMQLLATRGWEIKETKGLGWIEGEVKRLEPDTPATRVPHIGWNEVYLTRPSPLFRGVPSGRDFYFVHSYQLCPRAEHEVLARTPYCGGVVSAIERDNVFGVQFHPEKSQRVGFQVLANFLSL